MFEGSRDRRNLEGFFFFFKVFTKSLHRLSFTEDGTHGCLLLLFCFAVNILRRHQKNIFTVECPEIHLRIHLGIIKAPEGPKCVSALNVGSSLSLSPPIQFIRPIKRSWRSSGLAQSSTLLQ